MEAMKRSPALFLALLLLGMPAAEAGAQIGPDLYAFISKYFNPDPNAGLTAFRSLLIPMGGLAEGMGQAYTAVSRDSSYFESNPAASSGLANTELAIFHNNWIADTRIEGAVYTVRFGNLGFGAAGKWLYLPLPGYDDFGDRIGSGYYSEATAAFNASYRIKSGYYFDGLALGATAKLAFRSVPSGIEEAAGDSALAVMADLGALVRFNLVKLYSSRSKNAALGLTLKNLGPPVLGEALPTMASLGAAWSPLKPFLFSLDVSKPLNLLEPAKSERLIPSLGFLMSVTDFFRVQAGLLLKGGNPRISVGSSFDIELLRVTVNYTLDLTTQLTPLNRISLQAAFLLGDGGRGALAKRVENLYLEGLEAYARGDEKAAMAAWEASLALDPGFDPARESLETAAGFTELQLKLDEFQRR